MLRLTMLILVGFIAASGAVLARTWPDFHIDIADLAMNELTEE